MYLLLKILFLINSISVDSEIVEAEVIAQKLDPSIHTLRSDSCRIFLVRLKAVCGDNKGQNVVIITHGKVIKSLIVALSHEPVDFDKIVIPNTATVRVTGNASELVLEEEEQLCHYSFPQPFSTCLIIFIGDTLLFS